MNFKSLARIPVQHLPRVGDGEDALGNTISVFGPAEERLVYSIGPHVAEEGSATLTETEVADVDMAMPKVPVSLKDRFELEDGKYEVVGVRDFTMGFHRWEPGIVVELQKVT